MKLLRENLATVIAAVVVAAVLAAVFVARERHLAADSQPLVAVVHDGDGTEHRLPLNRSAELTVSTSLGTNTVAVQDGVVRMVQADCPNGDCLRQQAISTPGQQIVCLPHKLWIEVLGAGDGTTALDRDAVRWDDDVDLVAR